MFLPFEKLFTFASVVQGPEDVSRQEFDGLAAKLKQTHDELQGLKHSLAKQTAAVRVWLAVNFATSVTSSMQVLLVRYPSCAGSTG